jgi:hypothetical protein
MSRKLLAGASVFGVVALSCFILSGCRQSGSLPQPTEAAATTKQGGTESDVNLIYENHEPVGWVFGRVVGFEGADKPLLPRQTLPAPNPTMLRPPLSP